MRHECGALASSGRVKANRDGVCRDTDLDARLSGVEWLNTRTWQAGFGWDFCEGDEAFPN